MRHATRYVFVLGLLVAAAGSRAAVFTVGSDGACTHPNILAAVIAAAGNGAGLDEIRIATNQAYTNVIAPVTSHSVHLRGGFSSCTDTTQGGRTIVVGNAAGTGGIFSTSGAAAPYQLNVENLELRDTPGAPGRRGGALRIEGDYTVVLANSLVANNRAGRGGGIYIDGSEGAGLSIDAGSNISNNTATLSGGGIYCRNGALVFMHGLVYGNTAEDGGIDEHESGNGGGVALYDCAMQQAESTGLRGVLANTAQRHGGGYYVRNSDLSLSGNAASPAEVTDNVAVDTGGGVAVFDDMVTLPLDPSIVTIHDSWIDSNHASKGGGLGMVFGGQVVMQRTLGADECHTSLHCSSLSLNTGPIAGGTCFGAAAYIGPRAILRLRNTMVEQNCPGDAGWAFEQASTSQLYVDSSVVARNGGSHPFLIGISFTGTLEVAWSTIYGHTPEGTTGFFGLPRQTDATGTVRVYGSILGDKFQQMTVVSGGGVPPPMTLEFDCLALDPFYTGSASLIRSVEIPEPYGMVAPASGNYRLASTGTGLPVDFCDQSFAARVNGDIERNAALYDAPRANTHGTYDLGAFELATGTLDPIFSNGYE